MAKPGSRAALAKAIPHRPRLGSWAALVLALGFAALLLPVITAEHWLGGGHPIEGEPAALTVRVPLLAGFDTSVRHVGGGVVIARGATVTPAVVAEIEDLGDAMPHGPLFYGAIGLLVAVLAAIFSHHMRRSSTPHRHSAALPTGGGPPSSSSGRLARVQLASFGAIAVFAVAVKALMLLTPVSILVVPVSLFALVPTLCLDRIVGLATGVLAALVLAILAPFDLGVAILLLVQVAVAGLVVAERPKHRWSAALVAGGVATVFTAATFPVLHYLTTGHLPSTDVTAWQTPWLAAALGPAIATLVAVPLVPMYQRLVGEITQASLVDLEDLSNPLLQQIAKRAPGTWQHSLAMANLAEIAANAIGANGRLVRVGAYYHDLGKSLQPKYFIENLEPGETSPHDQLPPETSCDAIFKHVTEGLVAARQAGLHERIIDFMHMHHGNGVLEYFWARCREQGNPNELTVDDFRYPGVPPQTRETAILAICDAVEAASRTLKKPDGAAIDSLVQRIVYGKLHLGQLDESGLSMSDLRRVADSLRETIRHANHGRIEYPWQREEAAAAAGAAKPAVTPEQRDQRERLTQTGPRLDSLDRPARAEVVAKPAPVAAAVDEAAAAVDSAPQPRVTSAEALAAAPDRPSREEMAILETAPAMARPTAGERRTGRQRASHPSDSLPAALAAAAEPIMTMPAPAPEPPPGDSLGALIEPPQPAPARKRATATAAAPAEDSADVTQPRLRMPLPAPPASDPEILLPSAPLGSPPRPTSLAERIDAAIVSFDAETPVRPDAAHAAAPDVTKRQHLDELERLLADGGMSPAGSGAEGRRGSIDAARAAGPQADQVTVRRPHPTTEVDPDDIESSVELAPPAHRAKIALGTAKQQPKKPAE